MDITPLQSMAAAAAVAPAAQTSVTRENRETIQAVKAVNAAELFGSGNELTFMLDRSTRRPIIRLVDKTTKDVIRQIPPEYVLRLAEEASQKNTS